MKSLAQLFGMAVAFAVVLGSRLAMADEAAVAEAEKAESVMALPLTDFYRTSAADVHGQPGTLVRSEKFTGFHLTGVRVTRYIYRSRSQLGHETLASAAVIVPEGVAPAGGWPVLIWAHGTTGVARQCAPTLTTEVGYYTTNLVQEGIKRHFAVVAIDYSGMGVGEKHEYLWKQSNATDIAYAAPAARLADPTLAPSWVAIGHSQGGQAVWGLAEILTSLKDPAYRGAVALAPAVDSEPLLENVANTREETFYPIYVAYGINAVYPDYDVRKFLQPSAAATYSRVTTQGCWNLAHALYLTVEPGSVLKKNWTQNVDVKKFLKSNQVGEKPIAGPMMIGSGDTDTAVPARIVADRTKALCKLGATVEYKMYAGDHGTMMASSFEDQMQWITDRFAGKAAPKHCPN